MRVFFEKSNFFSVLILSEIILFCSFLIEKNLQIPFLSYLEKYFFLWFFLFPLFVLFSFYLLEQIILKFLPKKELFWQIAKFLLVGASNTLVDWGVFNLFILLTGIATGWQCSFFKGVSFVVAVINSYFWNKFWTFEKKETKNVSQEFLSFMAVSLIGFLINVSLASLVINVIKPRFGIEEKLWANFAAALATLVTMVWNFVGYKLIVFKK